MAKDDGDQTSIIMPGPKAERFVAIETGSLRVDSSYAPGQHEYLLPKTPVTKPAVELHGDSVGGRIVMREPDGDERVSLRGKSDGASLRLSDPKGKPFAYLGSVDNTAALALGGDHTLPGRVHVRDGAYQDRVLIWTSADGAGLLMSDKHGKGFAYLGDAAGRAELALGGKNRLSGRVVLRDGDYKDQIVLDADAGDIVLMNADCAEFFDVEPDVEPGTVLVIDDAAGVLRPCTKEYDQGVAGVLSGAGAYRPGLVLDYRGQNEHRRPVALMGKVYCKVEADSAPIRPGSLLTTSTVPGHARAATDRDLAFGAVLGKAMAGLDSGNGLLPILVTLQ